MSAKWSPLRDSNSHESENPRHCQDDEEHDEQVKKEVSGVAVEMRHKVKYQVERNCANHLHWQIHQDGGIRLG